MTSSDARQISGIRESRESRRDPESCAHPPESHRRVSRPYPRTFGRVSRVPIQLMMFLTSTEWLVLAAMLSPLVYVLLVLAWVGFKLLRRHYGRRRAARGRC